MRKQEISTVFILLRIFLIGHAANLIPQYQQGFLARNINCGPCSSIQTVTFPTAFTVVPQVIVSWAQIDTNGGIIGFRTEVVQNSITVNGFNYGDHNPTTTIFNGYQMYWFAFVDDNIYTQFAINTAGPVTSLTITYTTPQTTVPSVMIFTNSLTFCAGSTTHNNLVITLGTSTTTSVPVTITPGSGFTMCYVAFSVIYANPLYLETGVTSYTTPTLNDATPSVCKSLFTPITNLLAKYTGVGFNSFNQQGTYIRIGVTNNGNAQRTSCNTIFGQVSINIQATGTGTILTAYQVAYFQYIPCPYYCTACKTTYPNCTACKTGSQRNLAANCACVSQYYEVANTVNCAACVSYCNNCAGTSTGCTACFGNRLIATICLTCPSQFYIVTAQVNCGTCDNICNNCSGTSSTCTACFGNRLIANNCQACPSQFYIIAGQVSCAACLDYCNNCSGTASTCTACYGGRANAPSCNTCSATNMYIQVGVVSCQACQSYCNGCQNASTSCSACLSTTGRSIPPNCTTCGVSQYIIPGVDNCQQCNSNCGTCTTSANQCLTCSTSSLTLNIPNCITCPSQMYLQIASLTCQACSAYCDNCTLSSTNCTVCLSSTMRLYPPNCSTCPNNMFIQAGQNNCQQCNSKCNGCTVSNNNCTSCNGLYRAQPPNCNQCTQPNYYIDNSYIDCQPCSSSCNGCVNSANNCLACWPFNFGQLTSTCPFCPTNSFTLNPPLCSGNIASIICTKDYNRDSTCNCLPGYSNSDNQLSCLKCAQSCQTCTTTSSNCLTCNASLKLSHPPACDDCVDGWFMQNGSCQQCSDACITCIQSTTNCLSCPSPRINPPQCTCPNGIQNIYLGYFNNCTQLCSFQCQTCSDNASNCLTCSGNRISPPVCGCPDGTIQQSAICSSCSTAAPTAQFSNDLNSINIAFQFSLILISDCSILLSSTTLKALGVNPQCSVNQNHLILTTGTNPTITIQQPIFLNSGQLRFSNCNMTIDTIVTPIIQAPLQLLEPSLLFDSQIYKTTSCDNVIINIIGATNNGERNLTLLNWKINKADNLTLLQYLIQNWNSMSLQTSYVIDSKYLQNQQSIELSISFQNFVGSKSSQSISIQIQSEFLQIALQVPNKIYIFDTAEIRVSPSLVQCRGQQLIDKDIKVQVTLTNSTKNLNYNYTIKSNAEQVLSISPFELSLDSLYSVKAQATWNKQTAQIKKEFELSLYPIKLVINGGDQQIGVNQILNLTAQIFDPNIQTEVNVSKYKCSWICYNMVTSSKCDLFQYSGLSANLNTTNYQPFSTLQIQLQVEDSQSSIVSNNIIVSVIEKKVSPVALIGNQHQLNSPMNIYDQVDVTIKYQSETIFDIDRLIYYAQYIDSSYSINQIQLYHIETSIIVQNFLDYMQSSNFKFRVTVTNPDDQTIAVATQSIRINIPPQNCRLTISLKGSKYDLQIDSCISSSQPLQYQFVYYSNSDGFAQDSINGFISIGIQLNEFSIKAVLMTYLYGTNNSIIVGFIKDSYNGLSNTTVSLKGLNFIDQTAIQQMLKDDTINMSNNIKFILLFAQNNNVTLNSQYLLQIQSYESNLNQSSQTAQQIQQMLGSQQVLSSNEILQKLTNAGQSIDNIQSQLAALQLQEAQGVYNKNYQIQLRHLEAQVDTSSNQISFLYSQSQQVQNRRMLDVSGSNLTTFITQAVSNLTDIVGQFTKVNQNKKTISTPQFNLSAQKYSTEKINQNLGIQVLNSSNQTVSFKNQNFEVNPYQNQSDFANPIKAPLIIPNLTDSKSVQIKPANPIPITFTPIANATVTCASQVGGKWSLDLCKLVQSVTIQCLCETLSPLSLVQALAYILGQFALLFESTIISKIHLFPYHSTAFTYVMALFLFTFFFSIVILYRKDATDNNQVHPVDELPRFKSIEDCQKATSDQKSNLSQARDVLNSLRTIIQSNNTYTSSSLIGQIIQGVISKKQGFLLYLRHQHVIFELYYRYDGEQPRILRLSILYLQLFGQICIFVLFGKNLAISIVIGLSLFQTVYGIVFQMILSQMIKSKNSLIHYSGIIIAVLITGLCTYLIVASIALYSDIYSANIACLSYMASFCLDYFVSSILVELGKYYLILKTCEKPKFYKLFNVLIPANNQEYIFGRKLEQQQVQQRSTKVEL